jgi:proteasome lid subunit RPN8/RPN11
MPFFRSSEVIGIAAEALEFALQASEDAHPQEYMGFLRGREARQLGLDRDGIVLSEVLVIPGTTSTPESATVDSNMIPNTSRAAGSIHSHPNGVLRPSAADLQTFGKGKVHLILGYPYARGSWQAFDREGEPRTLDVLTVDHPEERFFDVTQAEIDAELAEDGDHRGSRGRK